MISTITDPDPSGPYQDPNIDFSSKCSKQLIYVGAGQVVFVKQIYAGLKKMFLKF